MIYDSEARFPNSIVLYTKLKGFALREMFAYLREREEILQDELKKAPQEEKPFKLLQLREIEQMLIWMVSNVHDDERGPVQMRLEFWNKPKNKFSTANRR